MFTYDSGENIAMISFTSIGHTSYQDWINLACVIWEIDFNSLERDVQEAKNILNGSLH